MLIVCLCSQAHNQGMINSWRRTLERTHARVEDLRNFRSVIFSGVFSHRFRWGGVLNGAALWLCA